MDAVDDTAAQLGRNSGEDSVEADTTSCLAVLIDLHSEGWQTESKVPLWEVLTNLMIFLNAQIALDSGNKLVIIGYNGVGARLLYSSIDHRPKHENTVTMNGTMIRQFKDLDEAVLTEIKSQLEMAAESKTTKATSVAGPLSLALTYLKRQIADNPRQRGQILVVSAEHENVGSKYIPAMNSIFTAQKLRIPIDVANFGPPKSFLQQAADFTGGSYLELDNVKDGLVAVFTSTYIINPAVRKYVNLATNPDVDFSAVCFLTKNIIEIGYVCSVCLCIMENVPSDQHCPVCNTQYDKEKSANGAS